MRYHNQGFEQLTVSSSAVGLASVPSKASFALINVQDAQVRFRDDGTNPTSTVGVVLNAGDTLEYDGELADVKFIRTGSTDAKLNVSYYYTISR